MSMRRRMAGLLVMGALALAGCATTQGESETPGAKPTTKPTSQSSRLMSLAADLEQRGEWETAITLYEQAAALPDAPASTFVGLGDVYMRSGYPDEAMKAFRAALSRSPKYGPALVGLGWAMIDQGDTEAGIRTLSEGAQTVNTSKAYNRLGVAQTFAGQIQPAMSTFARARALAPEDLDIQINMALAAALADDASQALPIVQNVMSNPGANLQHKRNTILIYGLLDRDSQARALGLTGLATEKINTLLSQARTIRAQSSVQARAKALGSIEV
ncbi:tetratricopeptide repeat protein [uncultured Nitratireductor sp.]|uniref:tetratricopeptide repeat protein n=1 Tax=uncultured Nitratireductor sp. TaxID=520953 RepID=UPI0025CEB331|nr:tetratricopeptide repeat protein [uncultured Nitratireductor sp.]